MIRPPEPYILPEGLKVDKLLSYKDELRLAMEELAQDPKVRFFGYGIKYGRANGTLKNVPDWQLIEMPVAENLLVSVPTGMALKGFKPLVFIERFDFIWNASDAIVNHLDKIGRMSRYEFNPTVILRIVVGNRQKPLFTGETHTQDYTSALRNTVSFPVLRLTAAEQIRRQYRNAYEALGKFSTALVEYKDLM